jgi:pyridoxal 5'-phosphate synthase pdxT subunit
MKIGVLALQGDFHEHQVVLDSLGVETAQVRLPEELTSLDGLIIPGGESTTIGKLAVAYGLMEPLKEFGARHALWGTCAGAIFLSCTDGLNQPLLELMNITIGRNAFGRQVDSFEAGLEIPALNAVDPDMRTFNAIFIRAPIINTVNPPAEVLAKLPDGRIVAARQGKLLATSFHPELTADNRFHRLFLEMTK